MFTKHWYGVAERFWAEGPRLGRAGWESRQPCLIFGGGLSQDI